MLFYLIATNTEQLIFNAANIIYYLIFISQIFLLSYHIPKKMLARMEYVLENCPEDEYPKLYVKPRESHLKSMWSYKLLNQVLFILGFAFLAAAIFWAYYGEGNIPEMLPWVYFMMQMFPIMRLEIKGFSYFKLMKKKNTSKTKKAGLQPRRFFDFVSYRLLISHLLVFGISITTDLYINDFDFSLGSPTFIRTCMMIAINVLFSGIIYWNLYGKKCNPHQDIADRLKEIKVTIRSLLYVSIGVSIYLMMHNIIDDLLNLDNLQAGLMSVYLQVIAYSSMIMNIKKLPVESINFDVYKADVSTT